MLSYYLLEPNFTFSAASAARLLLLDVVVPTFRCDVSLLNGIRRLHVPKDVAATFIFIIDDSAKKEQIERIKEWESAARPLGSVRVRVNDTNAGTRSRLQLRFHISGSHDFRLCFNLVANLRLQWQLMCQCCRM